MDMHKVSFLPLEQAIEAFETSPVNVYFENVNRALHDAYVALLSPLILNTDLGQSTTDIAHFEVLLGRVSKQYQKSQSQLPDTNSGEVMQRLQNYRKNLTDKYEHKNKQDGAAKSSERPMDKMGDDWNIGMVYPEMQTIDKSHG